MSEQLLQRNIDVSYSKLKNKNRKIIMKNCLVKCIKKCLTWQQFVDNRNVEEWKCLFCKYRLNGLDNVEHTLCRVAKGVVSCFGPTYDVISNFSSSRNIQIAFIEFDLNNVSFFQNFPLHRKEA